MPLLRASTCLVSSMALLLSASYAQGALILGGWTEANVTDSDVSLLVEAASNASTYSSDVTTAICLIAVEGLETQTVSGTNYKFQVAGCTVDSESELGACSDRDCDYSSYDVVIYSQPWTDTLEVTSITLAE
ncbi:hypothetical protein BBJ28_00004002 [Nothophytophthora sp. Chile5]|nr:hypothetical protein BBJ28_00004002 [Nothophytophthora sp. Chile5]